MQRTPDSPYAPLLTYEPHIRIAILAPGHFDDQLVLNLRVERFIDEDALEYEALSYAWGRDAAPQQAVDTVEDAGDREPSDTDLAHALMRVCSRPYFRRVWVVQELALAREEPMVHIGFSTFPWNFFNDTCDKVRSYYRENDVPLREEFWKATRAMLQFGDIRKRRLFLRQQRKLLIHEARHSFIEDLIATRDAQATDPRDKVYGLFGMSLFALPIEADYSKSAAEVYVETVAYLIAKRPVQLYSNFPLHSSWNETTNPAEGVTGLPSWAMDISIFSRYPQRHHSHYGISHCTTCFAIVEGRLIVQGEQFAGLVRVGPNNVLHTIGKFYTTISETFNNLMTIPGALPKSHAEYAEVLMDFNDTVLEPRGFSLEQLTQNKSDA